MVSCPGHRRGQHAGGQSALKVVLTDGWSAEQAEPYTADVFRAFAKLVEERPQDLTVQHLVWMVCKDGERNNLWLVLDEDGRFLSFLMTRIETCVATGVKSVTALNMAGEQGPESMDAIYDTVVPWAKAQGATIVDIAGRDGWWPGLKKMGFKRHAVLYRKEV